MRALAFTKKESGVCVRVCGPFTNCSSRSLSGWLAARLLCSVGSARMLYRQPPVATQSSERWQCGSTDPFGYRGPIQHAKATIEPSAARSDAFALLAPMSLYSPLISVSGSANISVRGDAATAPLRYGHRLRESI